MIRLGGGLGYRFNHTSGEGFSYIYAKSHLGYVYAYIDEIIWKYGDGEGYGDGFGDGSGCGFGQNNYDAVSWLYSHRLDDVWRKL